MSESNEAAKRAAQEAFDAKTSAEAKTLIETGFDPHEAKKVEQQRQFDASSRAEAEKNLSDLANEIGNDEQKAM